MVVRCPGDAFAGHFSERAARRMQRHGERIEARCGHGPRFWPRMVATARVERHDERREQRLDRRGDRIASRLERRSERFDRRWDRRH